MKNLILAVMAVLTLAGPASATSDWDYFWGTTLNPANTGWNDFWYRCSNPNGHFDECLETIVVGTLAVVSLPIVAAVGTVLVVAAAPVAPTILGIPIAVVTVGPPMVAL